MWGLLLSALKALARYVLGGSASVRLSHPFSLSLSLSRPIGRGVLFGFAMVWLIGWPVTLIMFGIEDTSISQYDYWQLIVFMFVYGFSLGVIIAVPITVIALMSPPDDDEDEEVDEDEEASLSQKKSPLPSSESED